MKLSDLFSSKGLKRNLASLIAMLLEFVRMVPGAEAIVTALEWAAAALGGAGVTHAAGAGTIGAAKIAGLSSILSVLLVSATFIPQLQPLVPYLRQLAGLLGAAGTGIALGKATSS